MQDRSNFDLVRRRKVWQPVFLLLLLGILLGLSTFVAAALPAAQTAAQGEAIFNQKCTGCHTIGKGRLVGPDLEGVTARRSQDWLVQFISSPDKMIAAKDPRARTAAVVAASLRCLRRGDS